MRHLLFTGRIMDLSAVRMLKPVESLGSARKPKQRAREEDVLVSTKIQGRGGSPPSRLFVFFFLVSRRATYLVLAATMQ